MQLEKKKNCVIYCRVSGNKQAQEGDSLKEQEQICRAIAERRNFNIVPDNNVYIEPFTGSKLNRPFFDELMKFIKNYPGRIDYFLFKDIDRLTRGGAGDYQYIKKELSRYGVELVDSYGLIQPKINTLEHTGLGYDWSRYSTSEMAETIKAESAKDERRVILTRLIGTEIALTQQGFWTGNPNDGFVNKRVYVNGKKRTIMIPDPNRMHFYIKMFELRASGKYSDAEIVDKINAMGFKTRVQNIWDKTHTKIIGQRGGKFLSIKQLQRIIQKPIHCGIICKKWTHNKPIRAKFDGLVSIEKFNKANNGKVFIKENKDGELEILYDYSPEKVVLKRTKDNPLFPYKDLVLCPNCGKPFLGSVSAGKSKKGFPFYHCSRGHKYFGINKKKFEFNFENIIKDLNFNKYALKSLKLALKDVYKSRVEQIADFETRIESNIITLKQRQLEAFEAFKKTSSSVLQKKLEAEIEELELQILKAKNQKPIDRINEYDIENFFRSAEYLMEHHEELLLNKENQPLQKRLLSLVFDEQPTYDDILNGTPKISFIFAKTKEPALAGSLLVALRGIEPLFTG